MGKQIKKFGGWDGFNVGELIKELSKKKYSKDARVIIITSPNGGSVIDSIGMDKKVPIKLNHPTTDTTELVMLYPKIKVNQEAK